MFSCESTGQSQKNSAPCAWSGSSTLCRPGSKRAIVYVLPDLTYPTMWRIRFPDGCLSAMANMSRAKDAALLHAAAILNRPGQGAEPLAAA
jgi:hypothetical protein